MKIKHLAVITLAIAAAMSISSFAGEWKQEADGRWWYQNDDGSYTTNGWQKIDNKDYYFDAEGWMLSNTTTPDGYQVGADGAWIENAADTASAASSDSTGSNALSGNKTQFEANAEEAMKYLSVTVTPLTPVIQKAALGMERGSVTLVVKIDRKDNVHFKNYKAIFHVSSKSNGWPSSISHGLVTIPYDGTTTFTMEVQSFIVNNLDHRPSFTIEMTTGTGTIEK